MKQRGKLYGVGVGPGDPELMTVKAIRTIERSDVIVVPVKKRRILSRTKLLQASVKTLQISGWKRWRCLWSKTRRY